MLSETQKAFLKYWEENRLREKKINKQLLLGLPIGLLFAIPVLILLFSGKFWYQRANMEANSQSSPVVLIIAIICIAGPAGAALSGVESTGGRGIKGR
jgi:hypothetical protein